jgi:hypothetical protein
MDGFTPVLLVKLGGEAELVHLHFACGRVYSKCMRTSTIEEVSGTEDAWDGCNVPHSSIRVWVSLKRAATL